MFEKYDSFEELELYLDEITNERNGVSEIHIHHTWSPEYKDFKGNNGEQLCKNMRNYHINHNKWDDIGQHFTIMPDGSIYICREINKKPCSIYGRNHLGVCIENVGNFDKGHDKMTDEQLYSLASLIKLLLIRYSLQINDETVVYHREYSSKTCPGTGFITKQELLKLLLNK